MSDHIRKHQVDDGLRPDFGALWPAKADTLTSVGGMTLWATGPSPYSNIAYSHFDTCIKTIVELMTGWDSKLQHATLGSLHTIPCLTTAWFILMLMGQPIWLPDKVGHNIFSHFWFISLYLEPSTCAFYPTITDIRLSSFTMFLPI